MANPIHKDPIFQMLKPVFRIDLFYKPTMESGDIHYHIILDNLIKMTMVLIGTNFLVIDSIEAMTSSYMPKIYDTLVTCLIEQKSFTVLIERLGNTHVIDDACVKQDVPIVVDERFITIPKKLYNMYMRYHGDNQDAYGFYLLAVNSDLSDIPDNKPVKETKPKPEVKLKKVEPEIKKIGREKILYDATQLPEERIVSIFDSRTIITKTDNDTEYQFVLTYLGILDVDMIYDMIGGKERIYIDNIKPVSSPVSAVVYMELFSILEEITSVFDVQIINVKNKFVFDVCNIRQYPEIKTRPKFNRSTMGNYQMVKYDHTKTI